MQIGNTRKCFKNTDALNLPHKSWSIGHGCCPGIGIFQSSLRDSNVQPGLRAAGHPFSSVNLLDSPFLPTLKLMTKLRSWKWEYAVVRARNSIRGNEKKNILWICIYVWFLSSYTFLLYFAPWRPRLFFSISLPPLFMGRSSHTQAFISWSVVWTPLGNLILAASMRKWPAFIMMFNFFRTLCKTNVYVLKSSWGARLIALYWVRPGSWLMIFHLVSM